MLACDDTTTGLLCPDAPTSGKVCKDCGEFKPLTEFYTKGKSRPEDRTSHCKPCHVRRNVRNKQAMSRKTRTEYWRRARYGLKPGEWDTMSAEQGHACRICRDTDPGGRGEWHTDHDHTTGEVRGILCYGCNVSLGLMKDSPERLRAAADYLERRRAN